MPSGIRPGDRVKTHLGTGKVVKARGNGALVFLDKYTLHRHFELPELELIEPEAPPKPPPEPEPIPPGEFEPRRKAIEALRFGLVPCSCIQRITIGYDQIANWVSEQLPHHHDDKATFSEVCGPFGSGKSHTMAVVRHVADSCGYVTAQVEVDGKKVSLSYPEGVLSSIWRSIRINGERSSTPLLDLYLKAIDAGHASPKIAPYGVDRIQANYNTVRLLLKKGLIDKYGPSLYALVSSSSEVAASQLKKEISSEPGINPWDFDVRRTIGLKVEERPYDFVESLVGHALVAQLAGYKGLVITIDEFEIERLATTQWQRVAQLLQVLSSYLQGSLKHPDAPLGLFVASVGQEGHVGDTVLDAIVDDVEGERYELETLPEDELMDLAGRIHVLYCDAYGIQEQLDPATIQQVRNKARESFETESGFIRYFIKSMVSLCDAQYGPPNHGPKP